MRKFIYIFCVLFLLVGCKTKYVTVEKVSTKDSTNIMWRLDSIYMHDSIFVNIFTMGDTVYNTKTVTKYRYRDRQTHDTVVVERHDTIVQPVPVEVVKTVTEYKEHWYDPICRRFTLIMGTVIIVAIVGWIVKLRKQVTSK